MKPLGSSDDLTDEGRIGRLAILGEVLADVAHEINNLMMAISGYARLEGFAQGKDASSNIKDIVRCASQVDCLTTDLLYFARLPGPGARGDVAEAIYRTLRVCGRKVNAAGSPSVSVDVSDELSEL